MLSNSESTEGGIMRRYYRLWKHFKNWYLYVVYKFGFVKRDTLVFETRDGVIVEVPKRLVQTFKEIFMDECYLTGLEKKVAPGGVVIDIGANAGYFTVFSASVFPDASIFSYEPIPANYALLSRHRDLNPTTNIMCFAAAVAGHVGEIELSFDASDSFTTSATMMHTDPGATDSLVVSCVTLSQIFEVNGITQCALLKMDCEGAEYDILYGCPPDLFRRIDQIAMEVHRGEGKEQNIDALETFLHKQGYATRRRPVGMLWAWRR